MPIGQRANCGSGMVMALNISAESTMLKVAAGYESGHTMVFVQSDPGALFQKLYCARPHAQPGSCPEKVVMYTGPLIPT